MVLKRMHWGFLLLGALLLFRMVTVVLPPVPRFVIQHQEKLSNGGYKVEYTYDGIPYEQTFDNANDYKNWLN